MSRFNSRRTRQLKAVPVSLHRDRQRQTSTQLRESSLTHLWIPFPAYASTDGEIPLWRTDMTGSVKLNAVPHVLVPLSFQK